MSSPVVVASRCEFVFPEPESVSVGSATIGSDEDSAGVGVVLLPMCCHYLSIVATAKTDVSWSMPTKTQALLWARL